MFIFMLSIMLYIYAGIEQNCIDLMNLMGTNNVLCYKQILKLKTNTYM